MQALQGLQRPGCGIACCSGAPRLGPSLPVRPAAPRSTILRSRQQAVVTTANFNPFKNFGKGSEEDARKALEVRQYFSIATNRYFGAVMQQQRQQACSIIAL